MGTFTACTFESEEPVVLEPCPDRERMYRDFSREGAPCLCEEAERYVLNDRRDKCIECTGDCNGKSCGDDGCGRLCGECPLGRRCDESFRCAVACTPNCSQRQCGDDGCGYNCGTCQNESTCVDGQCVYAPAGPPSADVAYACCTAYGACVLLTPAVEGILCLCSDVFGYYYTGVTCN